MRSFYTYLGLVPLLFLPLVESFNREAALGLLILAGSMGMIGWVKSNHTVDRIDLLWLAVLVLFGISTLFSIAVGRSFLDLLRYISYFGLFEYVRSLDEKNKGIVKLFVVLSLGLNIGIHSLLWAVSVFRIYLPVQSNTLVNFYYSPYGHNYISELLLLLFPILLFWNVSRSSTNKVRILILVILSLLIILTFSRGAYLVIAASLIVYSLIKKSLKADRWFIAVILLFFVCIRVFGLIESNLSGIRLPLFVRQLYKPIISEQRMDYLKSAWLGFKNKPITGNGLRTFYFLSKRFQSTPQTSSWFAHNSLIELLSEVGGIGMALFFILLVQMVLKGGVVKLELSGETGIKLAVLGALVNSLANITFDFISPPFYLFVFLALLIPPTEKSLTKSGVRLFLTSLLAGFMLPFSIILVLVPPLYNLSVESRNIDQAALISNFLPWDASGTETIAEMLLSENKPDLAYQYNRRAYRLEPHSSRIHQTASDITRKISLDSYQVNLARMLIDDPMDSIEDYQAYKKLFIITSYEAVRYKKNNDQILADIYFDRLFWLFPTYMSYLNNNGLKISSLKKTDFQAPDEFGKSFKRYELPDFIKPSREEIVTMGNFLFSNVSIDNAK